MLGKARFWDDLRDFQVTKSEAGHALQQKSLLLMDSGQTFGELLAVEMKLRPIILIIDVRISIYAFSA